MKPVITAVDLEGVPPGGEVAVTPETLITPLAHEEAERRGIRFLVVASHEAKDSSSAREEPQASAPPRRVTPIEAGAASGGPLVTPNKMSPASDLELEQIVRLVTEEVLAYLKVPEGAPIGERSGEICQDFDRNFAERDESRTRAVVDAGAGRISSGPNVVQLSAGIAKLIDHTLLKPEASREDIRKLCREAIRFGFATVCINPWYVPVAAEMLRGTGVKVCAVVGFPLGATLPAVKIHETEEVIKLGAQEIDMVLNIGALKSGQMETVESDIRGVVECSHRAGAICKVILETALLTTEEKIRACVVSRRAEADFVKTSTGFGTAGATAEDVALMRAAVGSSIGVKAAGGVQTLEDLKKMISAGATRIGASASVKIMEQALGAVTKGASAASPAAVSS
jgi:deoxyribose-phosphate aldolase